MTRSLGSVLTRRTTGAISGVDCVTLEEILKVVAHQRRALIDRLRLRDGGSPQVDREPWRAAPRRHLRDVHRHNVAQLLEVGLRARLEGRAAPPQVQPEALIDLSPAIERWGYAAEIALLLDPPTRDSDRELGEALLRLAPTRRRRALVARLEAGGCPRTQR